MGILTFLAIPYWVLGLYDVMFLNYHIQWGRFCPSKLGHNIFDFQIRICEFQGYFLLQIFFNQLIKHSDSQSRDLLEKTEYFFKMEKMPKIGLPISLQIDNSID